MRQILLTTHVSRRNETQDELDWDHYANKISSCIRRQENNFQFYMLTTNYTYIIIVGSVNEEPHSLIVFNFNTSKNNSCMWAIGYLIGQLTTLLAPMIIL